MNSLQQELTPMQRAWLPLKHLGDRIRVVRWDAIGVFVRVKQAQDGFITIIHPRTSSELTIPITECSGYSLDNNIKTPTLASLGSAIA